MWRELFNCALKTAKKNFYALAKIILPVNGELTNSSFRVEKAFIFCTENDVPGRDAEFLRQFIGGHKKLR